MISAWQTGSQYLVVRPGASKAPSARVRDTRCVMGQETGPSTLVKKKLVLSMSVISMLEGISEVVSQLTALGTSCVISDEPL
jgi:hypothetical protein